MEEILLGHQPYRMVKILRDMSMAEKRGTGEHARPVVAQDPLNKVKAALPEPKTPVMESTHSQPRYVKAVLAGQVGTTFASRNRPLPNDDQRDRSRCRNGVNAKIIGNLRCASTFNSYEHGIACGHSFIRLGQPRYSQTTINITEPPYTDPYVRWCGRRMSMSSSLSRFA